MPRLDHETRFEAAVRSVWEWMTVERQIILRSRGRVRYAAVSRIGQIGLGGAALALAGWVGYSTASYFEMNGTIHDKEVQIAQGERAYRDLLADMQESRGRFLEIAGVLENNHVHLVTLLQQNRALKGNLESASEQLERTQDTQRNSVRHQSLLKREVSQLEKKVRESETRNYTLASNLESAQLRLSAALFERTEVGKKGEKLQSRIQGLEDRLAEVRESQRSVIQRITEATVDDIRRLDRLIARTGLDSESMIVRRTHGQGGPFIPVEVDTGSEVFDAAITTLHGHMDRWERLQNLVRRLPLAAPVDHYYVASRFGRRRDPVNRRWSLHRGADLAGSARQPVYATAPGKIVFAGWKGRFGRFIEIDHGFGIRTRYGHLHRIKIKQGQEVKYRQRIGLLGSSGRSTGPHLHYEVLVNGKQIDPIKFVIAGKDVFKG